MLFILCCWGSDNLKLLQCDICMEGGRQSSSTFIISGSVTPTCLHYMSWMSINGKLLNKFSYFLLSAISASFGKHSFLNTVYIEIFLLLSSRSTEHYHHSYKSIFLATPFLKKPNVIDEQWGHQYFFNYLKKIWKCFTTVKFNHKSKMCCQCYLFLPFFF